jgi:hypothetical protein
MSSKLDKNKIFSGMATEHTLKEVVNAVKSINVNVGDIVLGDISVQSDDITTHAKLDITNSSIGVSNNKLDTINTTITNKRLDKTVDSVSIAGQTISVANLNTVAQQTTLSSINQKIPQLTVDGQDRLYISTEGQSINIGNLPENQTINGSVSVSNFPTSQTINGSISVSNQITGYALNSAVVDVKDAINNKYLSSVNDSVLVSGSVNVSNPISNYATQTTLASADTKLDFIKTYTSKINDITYTANNLNVNVSNLPSIQTVNGTVAISNQISGYSLDATTQSTNTKLDTLNTTLTNKHLDTTTDSVSVSGSVSISNESLVVDTINNSVNEAPYDLIINGATLWADSLPAGNPFFSDPNGREGWYYDNLSNASNRSNIYWYGNPTTGNLQENDMTYSQLNNMYCIITNDYVENGALTIPIMVVYSQPTGTNDIIAGFAHSSWSYALTNVNVPKMRKGETIMLYTGTTRPNIHINIPAYPLVLASVSGDALGSEVVAYMSINTQATTSKIGYLLQYTGYLNSSIGINREYSFKNSKERLKEENLSKLKFTGDDLKAVISNTGFNCNNINDTPLITGFATQATLSDIKTNTDKNKYVVDDLKAVISNTGFNCNNINDTPLITGFATQATLSDIKTNTDKNKYVVDDLKAVISNTGFNCNNINDTPLITGFATQATLSDIKTNTDKNKYVDDDLKAVISNTSFESKLRDGNNNVITSTVYGIDGVRGLDVSIKNATQAEPLQVEIGATNVINTFSTNLPVSYEITAGGYLSSAVGALNVNLRNTDGNAIGITGTPLVVESNLITGFALETGGNLATVATNSNKLKFTGDFLKTEVNASITNPLIVEELNPLTNYSLEDGGHLEAIKVNTDKNTYDPSGNLKINLASGSITIDSVNIKASNGDSLTATGSSLNTNITNTSLDVHNKVYHSGNWVNLVGASNGHLIVNSATQDGAGTDITSTLNGAKQSLDVNVANTGALKVDISGSTIIEGALVVVDPYARTNLDRINVGAGADIFSYAFGNLLNNTTINTGAVSTTISFGGAGIYGRRAMLMYRDGATSSTDSITYYTDSNFGTPEPLLLQTVYPIVNGGYRWSNVIINILPFTNIKIRNDSTTINNTNVYLTIVRV